MTKALAKTADGNEHLPSSEAAAIFSMIERVASAPDVPIERVEQLFKLYTQMDAERARRSYHAAFASMQPALPAVERKGKAHNSKYARFEDIVDAIMPVLAANGFGLSFRIAETAGKVSVTCILSHKDGHSENTSYAFPYDSSGSKNAIQSIGSATSYGKRYTMNALLGIATRDEDDDGNAACAGETIDEAQVIELSNMMKERGVTIDKFLAGMKIESMSDLPKARFNEAVGRLRAVKVRA